MSNNVFTLDALREETLRKYEPVVVELSDGSSIQLISALRLGKKDREEVIKAVDDIGEINDGFDDEDEEAANFYAEQVCDCIERIFRLIASKPKRLISELEHSDPKIKATLYTAVLGKWMGETQLGEAESSPA